jgi:CDP-4-dehydro-6-deoxyglucose reductase, E3
MPHVIYKGIHYPIRSSETILDGLLAGGADARYSCRRGSCHACLLQGDPALVSQLSKNRLPQSLRSAGMFLPCVTYCDFPLELRQPDWSTCFVEAMVAKKELLAGGLVRLSIDVPPQWQWNAGQYVYLRAPSGEARPYSIASVRALDYYLELHVQRYEDGQVSRWVADELKLYDVVHIRGPLGNCHYRPVLRQTPLLLLATGNGAGAALGVAREARLHGHESSLQLLHGVRDAAGLYLAEPLRELADGWPSFSFTCCCPEGTPRPNVLPGRITDVAFTIDRSNSALFLFGNPAMVNEAERLALNQGMPQTSVHADAFVTHPSADSTKLPVSGT